LRGVDLDCTAIAYHENEVYFNSISKFCYENACTILHKERNKFYEPRLSKYFEKGVDIILPDADVAKFPMKNLKFELSEVADLAYLGIIYNEIAEKRVFTDRVVAYHPSSSTEEDEKDFGFEIKLEIGVEEKDDDDDDDWNSVYSESTHVVKVKPAGVIVHENIIHLIRDLPQRFQYHGEGKHEKDVLLPIPKLTNRMITNSLQTVFENLKKFKNGEIKALTLEKYFQVKLPSQIIEDILVLPLREREKTNQAHKPKDVLTTFDKDYESRLRNYFTELIRLQAEQAQHKLNALREDFNVTENKTTGFFYFTRGM
jgi:hypothetical protein